MKALLMNLRAFYFEMPLILLMAKKICCFTPSIMLALEEKQKHRKNVFYLVLHTKIAQKYSVMPRHINRDSCKPKIFELVNNSGESTSMYVFDYSK